MLVIQRLRRTGKLGLVVLVGGVLIALGAATDVVVSLASIGAHAHAGLGPKHAGHLLAITGMALVMAGVVIRGTRRQPRPRAASRGGLDPNAHR